jgi:hypothetical protein
VEDSDILPNLLHVDDEFGGKKWGFDHNIMMKATCNQPPNVVEGIF